MTKPGTIKGRGETKNIGDLALESVKAAAVKGGKASPVLLKACATGEHIKDATIIV